MAIGVLVDVMHIFRLFLLAASSAVVAGQGISATNCVVNPFSCQLMQDIQLNDCDRVAICEQSGLSFECRCPDLYVDVSDNLPGRKCQPRD